MAQYHIKDKDDLILCPFDNTHMIRTSRMQYHLMQCKKNHPNKKFEVCQFNARHYVLRHELQHHHLNCPDRAIIQKDYIYANREQEGTYIRGDCSVPEYNNNVMKAIDGEDWDSECDNHARPFKWGETPINDHFHRRSHEMLEAEQQLRLPRNIPQVLRTPHGAPTAVTPTTHQGGAAGISQRLPRTLPATAAMAMAGRGRGVASLQSDHTATWGQPLEQAVMNGGKVGNRGKQGTGGAVPRGRGRGSGKKVNADRVVGISQSSGVYTDEDSSSGSSDRSAPSVASRATRGGRRVNAAPMGFSISSTKQNGVVRPVHNGQSDTMNNGQSGVVRPVHNSQSSGSSSPSAEMYRLPHSGSSTPERRSSPMLSYAQQAAAPSPTMTRHAAVPQQNGVTKTSAPANHTTVTLHTSTAPSPATIPAATMAPTVPHQPPGIRPHFGLMGIGRGQRLLQVSQQSKSQPPQFIVPNVNQNGTSDPDENKKLIRKYSKKIREIESLEQKRSEGETLNDEESAKVMSKKDLLTRLRQLHIAN